MPEPLITIGVPTYNRVSLLRRAVESALEQDCGDLEVLIADNASTDGTEDYCRALAGREPAVSYIRHPVNCGPTANFNTVLRHARGDYFLFLADDDWLDPSYSSRCLAWLRAHPDYAIAGGHPRYVRADGATAKGRPIDLPQKASAVRVRAYLRDVADNAAFYSVMPRAVVDRVSDIRNVMGADWLFMAEVTALGKVRALPDVHLHRSLGGNISIGYPMVARTLGLSATQGLLPFLAIGWEFMADVLWRSPVHRQELARSERVVLALLCGASIARRQAWLWVLGLGRLRLTRRPYRAAKKLYLLLDRRTGGRLPLRFPGYSTVVGQLLGGPREHESLGRE